MSNRDQNVAVLQDENGTKQIIIFRSFFFWFEFLTKMTNNLLMDTAKNVA